MVVLGGGLFLMSKVPLYGDAWVTQTEYTGTVQSASERRGDNSNAYKDFHLEGKAIIWP